MFEVGNRWVQSEPGDQPEQVWKQTLHLWKVPVWLKDGLFFFCCSSINDLHVLPTLGLQRF